MATCAGQRLLIGEELSEGRSIDVTALSGSWTWRIRARKVYQDNVTFTASHSLFVTQLLPVINETAHGLAAAGPGEVPVHLPQER